eukprot:gb/GECG01005745.1/.p1 GENE.gb/GECG01005745.1/~~gb/GECG01005745.1/.p1  ORF type:complete len:212 (+),score=10.52 gb/GECG01005745.1/:1-636(+)
MPLSVQPSYSSFRLQQLLYFNILYSIAYMITIITSLVYKSNVFKDGPTAAMIVQPSLFSLWAIAEIARLRIGYSGNVKQRIPELSAFLMLTIFPTFPFMGVLTFLSIGWKLPIDRIPGWFQIAFYIVEILVATVAVRRLIRAQTAQFFRQVQMQNERASLADRNTQTQNLLEDDFDPESSFVQRSVDGIRREGAALWSTVAGGDQRKQKTT